MKVSAIKLLGLVTLGFALSVPAFAAHERVHFETSMGNFDAELFTDEAPVTVANFLSYVDSGFFKGTIFHRIVPGFVAQGGGLTPDLQEKPTAAPIKNEAGNGLSNLRGTLAMARTEDVDSATSQFFVNLVDNTRLNHVDNTPAKFGYAVFGKIISGMDVFDQMQKVPEHTVGEYDNVPITPIVVKTVSRFP